MANFDANINALGAERNPALAAADVAQFADETAALLRRRLTAAGLVMSGVFAAAFVANLFVADAPLLSVRATILVVLVGTTWLLHRKKELPLRPLRFFELVIFGAIGSQLLLMMSWRILQFSVTSDGPSTVAVEYLYLSAWCIFLLTYGIFMPNPWKRAALVLLPAAAIPYLLLMALRWRFADAADALNSAEFTSPLPLPFVAAIVAVYGTHIIASARSEAFKARQFGQYHLKEKLGSGTMGEVYEAEHRMLKRRCAIKLIRSENEADEKTITRFEREVQSMARLSHWNSVEVFDYGRTNDGAFYYVMELLPGLSLEELVERHGPMPPERAIHFLRQTCHALGEAHAIGLIHRDIKPANIIAATRGGVFDVAKLLDFGLVRQTAVDAAARNPRKKPGGFSGSPAYMAPEQAADYENADERCDIYAVGALAYYLLSGQPPFTGENPFKILVAKACQQPTPLEELVATVPTDLAHVVARCLQKAPADRYQDAKELERALAACACAADWTEEKAAAWWVGNELDILSETKRAVTSDTHVALDRSADTDAG